MSYSGRIAIITGGLGGLGTSIGKLLRDKGASLAILYHPMEASRKAGVLETVFGSPEPTGVCTFECDVTSEVSVKHSFHQISSSLSAAATFPSILVNTAGYVTVKPFENTSAEEAMMNLNTNLLGPFLVSKEFYNLYMSRKDSLASPPPPGRIVNLSSQAAHIALDGHGPYCASKAGLLALTRSMAAEWGKKGITSNTISPTVILTALGKQAWADDAKRAAHLAQIPVERFGEPHEVASATEFLCRDESGMINGADIRVDGGFTIAKF